MTAPARTPPSFEDERAERLLLGGVLAQPDRFGELRADWFSGVRRELYDALRGQHQRHQRGEQLDIAALPHRLFALACDLCVEREDIPVPFDSLCRRLEFHAARRRLHVLAEVAMQLAADAEKAPDEFLTELNDVAEKVAALAAEDPR
jgi:hypothetical protein